MTEYEYRKRLADKRKEKCIDGTSCNFILKQTIINKSIFLVHKQDFLQQLRVRKKEEVKNFLIKSKIVKIWTSQFLLSKILNYSKKYIEMRIEEKRKAMAKFGSIIVIEKVLGRFLKHFKKQK